MVRRYELGATPGLGAWQLRETPSVSLGARDVRVRIRAASLNYRDLLVALGQYGGAWTPGLVPLSDGAGEVIEVGSEVSRWKLGDRVAANFFRDWVEGDLSPEKANTALGGAIDGVLAEEVVLPEHALVRLPDHLSFEQGACLPCAGLTAWNALFLAGELRPGETVLLQGTGGVSILALQMAKAAGARVILTSSSDEKLDRGRALGADETINYRAEPEWDKAARGLTDGRGVDLVLEVGGSDTMPRSLKAVRTAGRVVAIGLLSGAKVEFPVGFLLTKSLTVRGVYVGSVAMFEGMNRFLGQTRIEPVVDRAFGFEDAPAALAHLQSGSHFGKVVVRV